jgi:hypothetical protein
VLQQFRTYVLQKLGQAGRRFGMIRCTATICSERR